MFLIEKELILHSIWNDILNICTARWVELLYFHLLSSVHAFVSKISEEFLKSFWPDDSPVVTFSDLC